MKFIYKEILSVAVGFTIGNLLTRLHPEWLSDNPFQLLALIIILSLLSCIIHKYLGEVLFERKDNLVSKMMKCSLRKQYGLDYCVKCPDSYTCPTELSGMR